MINGKPMICVSSDGKWLESDSRRRVIECYQTYPNAVAAAGGIPLATSELCAEDMADLCDGLLLTGGDDVDPELYGETILNDTVKTNPARTDYEVPLLKAFMAREKPILCICRGFQLMNVVLGGTLYQDLVEQMGYVHMNGKIRHPIHTEEGSVLRQLFGETFRVNSTHHQAVRDVAPGLRVTAHSVEGIVEAYEHESLPILGTQFHPERLTGILWDDRTPDFLPYFQHFIKMVAEDAGKR